MVLARIRLACEERLVVLRGEVHVVVGERLLLGLALEPLVLRAAEQVQRVPPNLALGNLKWGEVL